MKLLLLFSIFWAATAQGQLAVGKLLSGAESANNTVDKVNDFKGKLKGLFPKKVSATVAKAADSLKTPMTVVKPSPDAVKGKVTVLTFTGVDYMKLKAINDNVKACAVVTSTNLKFSTDSSSISVNHSGTTDDLMKLIFLTCKELFTEKNIISFDEGAVKLKI